MRPNVEDIFGSKVSFQKSKDPLELSSIKEIRFLTIEGGLFSPDENDAFVVSIKYPILFSLVLLFIFLSFLFFILIFFFNPYFKTVANT